MQPWPSLQGIAQTSARGASQCERKRQPMLGEAEVASLTTADAGGRKQSLRAVGILGWRNCERPEGQPEGYVSWEEAREHRLTKATRQVHLEKVPQHYLPFQGWLSFAEQA